MGAFPPILAPDFTFAAVVLSGRSDARPW